MASVELNIEGLDEFNKKIAELKDIKKVRSKGMAAARKAMKIVELSAKIGDDTYKCSSFMSKQGWRSRLQRMHILW